MYLSWNNMSWTIVLPAMPSKLMQCVTVQRQRCFERQEVGHIRVVPVRELPSSCVLLPLAGSADGMEARLALSLC